MSMYFSWAKANDVCQRMLRRIDSPAYEDITVLLCVFVHGIVCFQPLHTTNGCCCAAGLYNSHSVPVCSSFDEIKWNTKSMFSIIFLSFLSFISLKTVDFKWFYKILQKIKNSKLIFSSFSSFEFIFKTFNTFYRHVIQNTYRTFVRNLALQNISFGWHSWLRDGQQLWQRIPTVAGSNLIVDMVDHMYAMRSRSRPEVTGGSGAQTGRRRMTLGGGSVQLVKIQVPWESGQFPTKSTK